MNKSSLPENSNHARYILSNGPRAGTVLNELGASYLPLKHYLRLALVGALDMDLIADAFGSKPSVHCWP